MRVKGGFTTRRRHKKIIKANKGYRGPAGNIFRRAKEAWLKLCDYLFAERNIRKITAGTLSVNHSMVKLMKRCGMVEDGIRRSHYLWNGKEVDMIYTALFQKDW